MYVLMQLLHCIGVRTAFSNSYKSGVLSHDRAFPKARDYLDSFSVARCNTAPMFLLSSRHAQVCLRKRKALLAAFPLLSNENQYQENALHQDDRALSLSLSTATFQETSVSARAACCTLPNLKLTLYPIFISSFDGKSHQSLFNTRH